jgi:ATP-binding protein involved in chromosome partitioning
MERCCNVCATKRVQIFGKAEMATPDKQDLLKILSSIKDPESGKDIVSAGMVTGLAIKGGNAGFALDVGARDVREQEPLRKAAEEALSAVPGIVSATVMLTGERESPQPAGGPAGPPPEMPKAGGSKGPPPPLELDGIKSIVAVASGKGGVGKSTVAVNLALGLKRLGLKVGLLDGDIYGPSQPRMLGITERPEADGEKIMAAEAYGIKVMSMGFLIAEDAPMIWRGPMVSGALTQMFTDVTWGELDVLIVDMPPGTGDAQLTLAQRVPVTGAVIVSTPQDIALIDARKGLQMFRKVGVPVFGIVENMSQFHCPNCGHESHIFGHGGARDTAKALDTAFLGEIPLHLDIRETSDGGTPIIESRPESAEADAFTAIAEKVYDMLESKLA